MKNTDTPSIERLKELLAKATPLPWKAVSYCGLDVIGSGDNPRNLMVAQIDDRRDEADANHLLIAAAINALPHLIATLETLPSAGEGEQPDCDLPTAEDVRGILSLPTTEIRREALEEAAAVAQRACEQRKEWALRGFGDRSQEEDRAAVASLIAKEIRDLASKDPSPPSRPSFDKWDYARAVLKDSEGCGR